MARVIMDMTLVLGLQSAFYNLLGSRINSKGRSDKRLARLPEIDWTILEQHALTDHGYRAVQRWVQAGKS